MTSSFGAGSLTLSLALRMADEALSAARLRKALVSVAVVDAAGLVVCFERMDGAEIAGTTLAVDKAYTAVAHRMATRELGPLTVPGGPLQGLHANGGGRYVVFAGGLPLWLGDTVAGAIGVSGGTSAQDEECAQAASALWRPPG